MKVSPGTPSMYENTFLPMFETLMAVDHGLVLYGPLLSAMWYNAYTGCPKEMYPHFFHLVYAREHRTLEELQQEIKNARGNIFIEIIQNVCRSVYGRFEKCIVTRRSF